MPSIQAVLNSPLACLKLCHASRNTHAAPLSYPDHKLTVLRRRSVSGSATLDVRIRRSLHRSAPFCVHDANAGDGMLHGDHDKRDPLRRL